MSHRIDRVDPDTVSEADLASWHRCRSEAVAADLPGDPPPTRAEVVADLWPARGSERLVWFARDEAGEVVGEAWLDLYGGENDHVGEIAVRVRPDARRRGIGTGLFDPALRSSRASGRTVARSWAVGHPGPEEATGELAGYTEVALWPGRYRAHQWGTTVLPEFRGRGLGVWMKGAMIEWLRAERHEVTEYQTLNSEDNPYIVAVNERLGYRPVDRWVTWLREI